MGVMITHSDQGNRTIDYFLDHEMLTDIGSHFPDLIDALHFPVHLKDAQTEKYILNNRCHLRSLGLIEQKDLTGLSVDDLFSEKGIVVKNYPTADTLHWRTDEIDRTKKLEHQVKALGHPGHNRNTHCLINGFVQFEDVKKIPVFERHHRKTIAILTYCRNVTFKHHLLDLFQVYRQYYSDAQAIQLLAKYLKIDSYFIKLPSVREMQMLFALHGQVNRKKAASLLNISYNTLASHCQHLKEKLIVPDLNEILIQLRKAR